MKYTSWAFYLMLTITSLILVFFDSYILIGSSDIIQNTQMPGVIQSDNTSFVRGTVTNINRIDYTESNAGEFSQTAEVKLENESQTGRTVAIEQGGILNLTPQQPLNIGDEIILVSTTAQDGSIVYNLYDRYRLPNAFVILFAFIILIVIIAGKKGIGSILGLLFSILVILKFILPSILAGSNPVIISVSGAMVMLFFTMYLAHGINSKTTIAFIATGISLAISAILAFSFTKLTHLSGLVDSNSFILQVGGSAINIKGILLGGIILGALGVLDDVTTTQSATVFELHGAHPKFSRNDLFKRAFTVGKAHIASLVNTLALAYIGASLTIFLILVVNSATIPYWVLLNSEMLIEEFVRTMAGSFGLILAVPITTFLSTWYVKRENKRQNTRKLK